jgi:hypothetical protein
MSDLPIPTQHESAVAVLRDRERELDADIQADSRALELKTARRDELLDLIATLSRRPRVRTPRVVRASEPANDQPEDASQRPLAPPTVFATPSLAEEAAA